MSNIVLFITIAIVIILVIWFSISLSKEEENPETIEKFGGFYYPYDYPYYWPYFYSGCNENMFGDISCLPPYIGYW